MKIFIGGISPEEIEIHFYHGILVLLCVDSETLLVYCNHVIYRLSFQPKFPGKKKKSFSMDLVSDIPLPSVSSHIHMQCPYESVTECPQSLGVWHQGLCPLCVTTTSQNALQQLSDPIPNQFPL